MCKIPIVVRSKIKTPVGALRVKTTPPYGHPSFVRRGVWRVNLSSPPYEGGVARFPRRGGSLNFKTIVY